MGIENIKHINADIDKAIYKTETIWSRIDDRTGSPGPKKLIGGNMQAGFFGEVPTLDLISGKELSRKLDLTYGTTCYPGEPWLKFAYLGKIEFISKKPIRHSISKNYLLFKKIVYGDTQVEIRGKKYKVRLIKGKKDNLTYKEQSVIEGEINWNSEWNKLILPIHSNAPSFWKYKGNVNSPTENWGIGYTDKDLLTHESFGSGAYTLCQERGEDMDRTFVRGRLGVSFSTSGLIDSDSSNYGWRPVLELVEEV